MGRPAEWFADWFDSPWYHLLYRHRDEAEAETFLQKLLAYLNPEPQTHILDLACGKGRHAVLLNKHGFRVTGLDLSPQNISYARQLANENLRFREHDMRSPFGESEYGLALSLFTSFGYFETEAEDRQVLQNIRQALVPGGIFVLDFMNAEKELASIVPEEKQQRDNMVFHIKKEVKAGCLLKHIAFTAKGRQFSFTERVRGYGEKQLKTMLAHAGLAPTATFGDYGLEPFEAARSPRLLLVAQHR